MADEDIISELSEDMEVIGPGQMLADARKNKGLSQEYVAEKLNFRLSLLQDMESEVFDKSIAATYNRGYLKNYAKLVNISVDEVMSSYEMLGVAEKQCAEMQSFSKITEKKAQNSRLMWISYLILAVLVGSTLTWWLQENSFQKDNRNLATTNNESSITVLNDEKTTKKIILASNDSDKELVEEGGLDNIAENKLIEDVSTESTADLGLNLTDSRNIIPKQVETNAVLNSGLTKTSVDNKITTNTPVTVIFTFAEDCWVNLYDGTGERIAWGIKKAGYVMTVSGQSPWNVTLGKPELVSINYDGNDVDMSQFNVGNIAKFSLPLTP